METQRVINFPAEGEVENACEKLKSIEGISSFKILNFVLQSGEVCVWDISHDDT